MRSWQRILGLGIVCLLLIASCGIPPSPLPTVVPATMPAPTITPTRRTQLPNATPAATSTLTRSASTPTPAATPTACGENPPPNAQPYLKNPSFEETIPDQDGTLDPQDWEVTEGKTIQGTHDVIEEMPSLVQGVGPEGPIRPYHGNRMLKVDARLTLKSSVFQYYPQPVSEGRLIQELAVYPLSKEYVQQIEIRGERDFKGVEGKEMFHLRWTDEGLLLRVRTGRPDFKGQSGFYKIFSPLPRDRWSFIRLTLEKTKPTHDREGRTISQWKLTVEVNGKTLFDSDQEKVYAQYIRSAEFVFIGDETMSGRTHKLNPSNTGDGIGIVYYDAVRACR